MFRKSYLSVFLILLMLVVAPLTLAQDDMFGLSAEDFALFSSPNVDADSLSFDFAVNVDITGAPSDSVLVDISGSGIVGEDGSGLPVGSVNLAGTVSTGGETIPVDIQLRAVDGVLYFNLGDGGGWMGQSLDDALETVSNMAPLPVDPMALASGDLSDDPEAMEALGEAMGALASMDPTTLISIARLDDMMGQAHFHVDLDLMAFLTSDSFTELVGAAGTMSGDESMEGMAMMVNMLLNDIWLSYDQFVELETSRVRGGILDFGLVIDPSAMGAEDAEPVSMSFLLDVSNVQYDVAIDVGVPEGATLIPAG